MAVVENSQNTVFVAAQSVAAHSSVARQMGSCWEDTIGFEHCQAGGSGVGTFGQEGLLGMGRMAHSELRSSSVEGLEVES